MNTNRRIFFLVLVFVFVPINSYAFWYCSEPSEPIVPSGYIAESYSMESAKYDVESYIDEVQDYKQCLADCIDEANSQAQNIIDEWNSAVQAYNNR
ncbi:hypothetical protein ACFL17_08620 [Pseudomonadota bacterium]